MTTRFMVVFTQLIIIAFVLNAPVGANHVKCKCPQIDARGTGDSSCSASESSGRCTIAFNEFDNALERTAKNALQHSVQWRNIQYQQLPPDSAFTRQRAIRLSDRPESLIDQLLIYSFVSLAERGIIKEQDKQIGLAHDFLNKHAQQISDVFVNGGKKINSTGLTVTLGCIAYRTGNFWIMYKAAWSASISNDQC